MGTGFGISKMPTSLSDADDIHIAFMGYEKMFLGVANGRNLRVQTRHFGVIVHITIKSL
jgi:hypothetical protein